VFTFVLAFVLAGCAPLLDQLAGRKPIPIPPHSPFQTSFSPLSANASASCVYLIQEPQHSQLLEQALKDSQLQAVRAQLESRGLTMNLSEAMALRIADGEQVLIPFGNQAHLLWSRRGSNTAAIGLIQQGKKTLNVHLRGRSAG